MKTRVAVSCPIQRTPRAIQLEGIFDIPPAGRSERAWEVNLPIEEQPWNIGLIVGPSGSGKTTVARDLFGFAPPFSWPEDRAVVDAFPAGMPITEITELLSSVGFSSPPSWLRPYSKLSNGEQFRVTMARVLAEAQGVACVDEFTSVVDRTVAQIGSAAIAKTIRRRKRQFVAVSCHFDIIDWLQPDWIYEPGLDKFQWRLVQRRPPIDLVINRVHHSAWDLFKRHHYLTAHAHRGAIYFCAFWRGVPVAIDAWLPFVGRLKDSRLARRGHRTVCLPDYQGVGIGNALFTFAASLWAGLGYRAFSCTGHPAEMRHRARSPLWKMTRAPGFTSARRSGLPINAGHAHNRLTASFEYVGPPLPREHAMALLDTWAIMR